MSTKTPRIAVVLLQFGGPDSLEAVEPFLYNLFMDPDIFELPFGNWFRKRLAYYISHKRAPEISEKYGEIGGKSPIVERTFDQVAALQSWFDRLHPELGVHVELAMRYWNPLTENALRNVGAAGINDVVLLPLYAQYSKTNAGSSFNEWDRESKRLGYTFRDRRVEAYYDDPKYLAAMNERIEEGLRKFENPEKVTILFSAHGIPQDMIKRGDPYADHVKLTMEGLMKLRPGMRGELSFQSKVGPKRWLEPNTEATIERLGDEGVRDLLVVPIAFVSDHIETLHELEIEARETAEEHGIHNFVVMEGLNSHPLFIEALGEMALKEIRALKTA